MTEQESRRRWPNLTRDGIVTALAVFILVWQTVFEQEANPTLVFVAAAMLGFPLVDRAAGSGSGGRKNGNGR